MKKYLYIENNLCENKLIQNKGHLRDLKWRSLKKISFIMIILFIFTSCEDVLDKQPLNIITDAVVWNDETLIDAYLTRCYTEMYVWDNENYARITPSGSHHFAMFVVNQCSDECAGRSLWDPSGVYAKFKPIEIDGAKGILQWWETPYETIRKLNEFIERVPDAPVDEDFISKRINEARFLRAFDYFSMVKRYGGVPLITNAQNIDDPAEELYPARNKEQEVYDFVISEMDEIIEDGLPETVSSADYGRPTKFAALALKCRAALYAGSIAQYGNVQLDGVVGIDQSLASSYYQKAYDAAKQIMNSGHYALYDEDADKATNFRNVFLVERNSEAIFVRQHDYIKAGNIGTNWDFWQQPIPNGWGSGNLDWPYLEMVEEFEYVDGTPGTLDRDAIQQGLWTTEELWANKDPRFFSTIYTQNTEWKGSKLDMHYGVQTPEGDIITSGSYNGVLYRGGNRDSRAWGFGVLKYCDENKSNRSDYGCGGIDRIVFRYAEVLLNCAEAAYELGKTGEALDAINQIRERAGIAVLGSIDRDNIRHERKVELAYEGHRYWDLRRWRTAVDKLTKTFSTLQYILDYNTGKYKLVVHENFDGTETKTPLFYERNYYLPITLVRTGSNSNLIENPGY